MDKNLKNASRADMLKEIKAYRKLARKMDKARGNARCWIEAEFKLPGLLPENTGKIHEYQFGGVGGRKMTKEEFLRGCRGYANRQCELGNLKLK